MASYSSLSTTQRCPRSRILRSVMKGHSHLSDAFVFGRAYHLCIEHDNITSGILELQKHSMDNQIPLLIEMFQRFKTFIELNGIKILEHEVEFHINMDNGEYMGVIDAILEYAGEIYLGEFKTAKTLSFQHIEADAQITSYLWACDKLNIYNPKGLIWIGNKKASEKKPTILKNGSLSTAKNQGCSYATYRDTAIEMYGDQIPQHIEEFMEWLKNNDNPTIAMVITKRSTKQKNDCEHIINTLMRTENEIMTSYKEEGIVNALRKCACLPDKMCMQSCLYKDLCVSIYSDEEVTDEDVTVYVESLKEVDDGDKGTV